MEGQRCLHQHSPDVSSSSPPQRPPPARWLLAACGGGDGISPASHKVSASAIPQADIDKAMDTETTLTFWTWVPDIKNEVKLFTKKYPKIKVNLVNVGRAAPHYQKMRTAIQSGQGAPDVTQVEFQFINSFTLGEGPAGPDPVRPADVKDSYPDWIWSQVNFNGGPWGIPQDAGPMGLLYREDLLSDAGIEVPKTWDDFAAAAETYHSKNPKSYLTNVAPNQAVSSWPTCGRPVCDRSASTATKP